MKITLAQLRRHAIARSLFTPTTLKRHYGMKWGIGGWLLTDFLEKTTAEKMKGLQQRAATGIKSTFATQFTAEISLAQALTMEAISEYSAQRTGKKYLINPSLIS